MKQRDVRIKRLFASLLKFFTAAVLIYIPLYPKFPLILLPGYAVAIRAEDFLILVTGIIFVINLFFEKKKLPPLALEVAIFIFVGFVSSLSAIFITQNVSSSMVLLHLARRLEYVLAFFFVYYVGKEGWHNRRFLYELILLPSIGVFLYGLAQIFLSAPVISTMNKEFAKGIALVLQPGVQLSSTFAGHYDLAIYLAMILAYLTVLLTFVKRSLYKVGLLVSFIALLWLFTQAGSRIAIFGLTFSLLLITFLRHRLKLGLLLIALVIASIFTSPGLVMRLNNLLRVFQAKFQSVVIVKPVYAGVLSDFSILGDETLRPIQEDRSTSIRLDVEWPRAIRALSKNPFLGTGYSSITLATDNEYLRSLGETGLIGFFAFAAVLISLYRRLKRNYLSAKSNLDKIITLSALAVFSIFLISGVFLDVFESSKIAILFWAFTGLAVSTKS